MEQRLPHLLKTLALVIWSAVLLYFCLTGRLNIFLTPVFRPLVWFAGFTLAAVAICYGIFARPGRRSAELECEHHHEQNHYLPFSSFLVLVLPVCLALFISPEGYSKMVISNRGLVNTGTSSSSQLALWADSPAEATANASQPEIYAPDAQFIQPAGNEAAPPSEPADEMLGSLEPPLPQADGTPEKVVSAGSTDAVSQMRSYLDQIEKDEQGFTKLEATDLVYAASQPGFREAMQGMKVVMVGQYYPGDEKGAQKLANAKGPGEADPSTEGGQYFWAVRMSMVCCAADARPTAVKVDKLAGETKAPGDMEWIKTQGTADFRETGPKNGDPNARWEAWIKPVAVDLANMPDEPYLF